MQLCVCVCSCCCSVAKSCPTLWNPMNCSAPGFPVLHYLPEFAQTHVHWVSDTIQPSHLCCPLLLLPSTFPRFRVCLLKWVDCSHQVIKLLELHLQHWSVQWISGSISFRIDKFDLLAGQGTLKSLLQHHSSKTLFFWHSTLFMVQLSHPYLHTKSLQCVRLFATTWTIVCQSPLPMGFSRQVQWSGFPFPFPFSRGSSWPRGLHPYMTTGKTTALTRWTFVGKVISLIFNTNSRKQQLELDMEKQTGSK